MTSLPDAWVAVPTELGGHVSDEDDLWRRAVGGERLALRRVYDLHARSIHRFLRDLLRDDTAAADATQETFARAFRALGSLRDGDRLKPWLFGIARNVSMEATKARRRAARRAPRPEQHERELEQVDSIDPESLLLGREAEEALSRGLAGLGHSRRAALLMRVDHGLSYEEIATLCGWSLAKVKVEIHRARRHLRASLVSGEADETPAARRSRGAHGACAGDGQQQERDGGRSEG